MNSLCRLFVPARVAQQHVQPLPGRFTRTLGVTKYCRSLSRRLQCFPLHQNIQREAFVDKKSDEERKKLLAQAINSQVIQGARVESQSDFQAIFVKGKPVNHILHLIISLVTCGLWLFVWAALALIGGEKRYVAQVDDYGNTNIQR